MPSTATPWAVILAGGDGTRLRPLTQHLTGDTRPKQFCRLFDGQTLLDQTRRRADLFIPPARQLVVVTRAHAPYYADLAHELSPGRLVVQPDNRGTAPAIMLAALALRHLAGDVPMVVLPSDHDVADGTAFMSAVADASRVVETTRDAIVLLGIEARSAETEYGWIEPAVDAVPGPCPVRRFCEKPSIAQAYEFLPAIGFSERVLAQAPDRFSVLRVRDVGWNDLGNPRRAAESARRRGQVAAWATSAILRRA